MERKEKHGRNIKEEIMVKKRKYIRKAEASDKKNIN